MDKLQVLCLIYEQLDNIFLPELEAEDLGGEQGAALGSTQKEAAENSWVHTHCLAQTMAKLPERLCVAKASPGLFLWTEVFGLCELPLHTAGRALLGGCAGASGGPTHVRSPVAGFPPKRSTTPTGLCDMKHSLQPREVHVPAENAQTRSIFHTCNGLLRLRSSKKKKIPLYWLFPNYRDTDPRGRSALHVTVPSGAHHAARG